MSLNIRDFFDLPSAEIFNPDKLEKVRNISIDSRDVKKGSLFIAIKGKRFDGHDFIRQAVKNGAGSVMMNRNKLKDFDNVNLPIITVRNTTEALGDVARFWRKKLNTKIIGITGSTGKTSTKDILASLLSEKYIVNKTEKNNNNHIGVPLTILSTNEKHDVLVAELGTNHFGEIEYTAGILNPDYALITNIGNSHIEFLKNKKGVFKEKIALFRIADKRRGMVCINNDDSFLKKYSSVLGKKTTYGFRSRSQVNGKVIRYINDGKPIVEIKYKNHKLINTLPLYGEQSAKNYLAATAVALELGLTNEEIKKGTAKLAHSQNRLNVKQLKDFILIDDTYNASPDSMKAAIELVSKIKTYKRKVLILGDMLELGKEKIKFHTALFPFIIKGKVNELYTIGQGMKSLCEKFANKKLVVKNFRTRKSLTHFLKKYDTADSVILIKGSRGMRMEEFVQILLSKTKS